MALAILTTTFLVVFIFIASIRGFYIGFIRQVFSTIGLISGLTFGILFSGLLISKLSSNNLKISILLVISLVTASIGLYLGELIGEKTKYEIKDKIANEVDSSLGALIGLITSVIILWVISSVITVSPLGKINNIVFSSPIIRYIDNTLPSLPTYLTDVGNYLTTNNFPRAFSGVEPTPEEVKTPLPNVNDFNSAINTDKYSVVKITGKGCGGLVEGSGFVVSPDIIATNAHVVAGVSQINVADTNGNHSAEIVSFDPNLDLAFIRVANLAGKPLIFSPSNTEHLQKVLFLGFPENQQLKASTALLLNNFRARGYDIYGSGDISRDIYEIKGSVKEGDSGGPLINADGQIIGMIFARSIDYQNIGYVLENKDIKNALFKVIVGNNVINNTKCIK